MSQPWISLLNLPITAFPAEIFGYPEGSPQDDDPIYHVVLGSPEVTDTPPLPREPMRMKIVLADGSVIRGAERTRPRPLDDPLATFTCPDCRATMRQRDDVVNSYCARCHAFKWQPEDPRCMEPTCPDFGSYDFAEGTCPQEHAVPPARR